MSLQRRLTKGLVAVLGVIIIFMALNLMSYWDIDAFVTIILPPNVTIARTYERFGDTWSQLFEKAKDDNALYDNNRMSVPSAQLDKMTGVISRLKNLVEIQERIDELTTIEHYAASFTRQLNSYYLLLKTRNRLQQKSFKSRKEAASVFKTEALNLLERFKSMLDDFNSALKNPDFKASLGQTSTLLDKIARIEKDLVLAETEVSLYISQSDNAATNLDPNIGKKAANRVETRLRAILFLLENSINESDNPISRRVLSQVEKKIRQFYNSFQKMRNILETPRGELLEIEDQLLKHLENLAMLKKLATDKALEEAEFFWRRIFSISDQIKEHAYYNHRMILAFLLLVLIAGIYISITIPRKIGGPLKKLNHEISNYRLGSEIVQLPASGTEEIDSIAQAFKEMAQKLNLQAEINRNYLESIHSLTKVYRELHETRKRIDQPTERLEKAINSILEQLITQCPKIDLLKVMVKKQSLDPEHSNKNFTCFIRLGEPCFSEKFVEHEEYKTYCKSTRWNPENSAVEEIIPEGQGLTGYFAEMGASIKTAGDSESFFQEVYQPQKLSLLPTLKNRDFEQGLEGCVLTEPLNLPPGEAGDEKVELGILFVYFIDPETKLSWQDIFFIQIIASQLASIIETDKLLHERDQKRNLDDQLDMARQIQDNLLPHTIPELKNLKITRFWKSAAEVGGDYYDFFALKNNRLGVVIADASGKNIPAAIIMTVFKTALSTMDLNKLSAAEVLTRANKVIAKNITPDRFITAMYAIIDSESGSVELSSAGHNPAFVVSGRGMELALHEKNVRCLPLGIMEDFVYESIRFKMEPQNQLFLYTDGVTEARDADGKEFGESGLKRFLALPRPSDPAAELGRLLLKYSENAAQHDDITAVSIEFKVNK